MIGRFSGLPTASRLIFVAAEMYRDMSPGVMASTSALLSKPNPAMSPGSSSAPVDVEPQDVVNRVDVFDTIQAMRRDAARVGRLRGGAIERGFHRTREGIDRGVVRSRTTHRRHLAGPQLPDNLLEDLGIAVEIIDIHVFERQPAGLEFVAMASDAVLVEQCSIERGVCRDRRCGDDPGSVLPRRMNRGDT
jgi:hypothetical protein